MRKMKKINGFLVVRFNDREKRNNPTLGSFGVIDAEQYTGDIDFDLDAMEYTDADRIEIAVEQARGLEAEEDFGDESTTYTVITETAKEATEEEVEPKLLALSYEEKLNHGTRPDVPQPQCAGRGPGRPSPDVCRGRRRPPGGLYLLESEKFSNIRRIAANLTCGIS